MRSIKLLRISCASVMAEITNSPPVFAQPQAVVDQPAGWAVSAPPGNPALAALSEEQLVDRLQETESTVFTGVDSSVPFWPLSGVANLGGGSVGVPIASPAAVELVRRGWRALPALLAHLTDARPTKLVYAVPKPREGQKEALAFGDEYDPRIPGAKPAGVNTGERTPLDGSGTYTFRVGELCYATLGQIVDRDLRAVRCQSENATMFSGMPRPNRGDWFRTINSPIIRPALATAARLDWGGIAAQVHADSLRDDFLRPVPRPATNVMTTARPLSEGALARLLYYYPSLGTEQAAARLRRKLMEPVAGFPGNPDENSVNPWEQARFVATLAPFRSDRLQAALLDLFRRAAALADADLRLQPPGTWNPSVPSLGSDLALACARRLAHRGYDDELKAFFTARVAAIETANKSGDPAPGKNLGSARMVNQMQADECRKFISELENGSPTPPAGDRAASGKAPPVIADARVRLGPVTLTRDDSSLRVRVRLLEPALGRVFVGRVIIDRAKDDVGVALLQDGVPMLEHIAVGGGSEAETRGLPQPALEAMLTRPSPQAKTLAVLEGRVELVVPDFDPDAVVVVPDIATKLGTPIDAKGLRAEGMSITIHDRTTAGGVTSRIAAQNEARYGEMGRTMNQHMFPSEYEAGDVALSITDPDGRFLNVEFRDTAGNSLRYNHNGWSHSSSGSTRFDVYRVGDQIPAGTQMVVWLRTEKSFVVVPLKAANLPLPEDAVSGR